MNLDCGFADEVDEVEDSDEIVLSDREVTELVLSGHVPVGEVLRSSAGG